MKKITFLKINLRTEIILFSLILFFGVFLRLWKLDSLPNGLDGDVAVTARNALHMFTGSDFKVLQNNQIIGKEVAYLFWSMPLGSFLIGLFINLFKEIEYGALFSSAFVGIISIPLVYLLAKKLTNVPTALLATFFFTFSPIHLVYSRSGYTHITLIVTLVTASTYLLYKTVQTQNTKLFYLCGIVWGLILFNSYPIAYVVAPISVVFLIWSHKWMWLFSPEFIISIIVSVITFLLLSLGFAYLNGSADLLIVLKESYYQWIVVRLNETRVHTTFINNITSSLNMLFIKSIPGYQFGILKIFNYPILDPITKITFLAGLLISLVRRNLADKILVLWVAFAFLITSVINIPQERYLFVLLPALYVLSASAIYPMLKVAQYSKFPLFRPALPVLIFFFVIAFAYGVTYQQYFVAYAKNNANMIHGLGDGDVADYLRKNFDPKKTMVITSMSLVGVESDTDYQYKQSTTWSEFLVMLNKIALNYSPYELTPPAYPNRPIKEINDKNINTFWYGKTPATFYLSTAGIQTISSIIAFYSTIEFARSSSSYSIESQNKNSNQWSIIKKEENENGASGTSVRNLDLHTNRLRFNLTKTIVGDALQKVEEVMVFSNPDKQLFIPSGVTDIVLILALNPNFKNYGNYDNLGIMMHRQADAVFGNLDSKLRKTVLGNNGEAIYKIYSLKVKDFHL